MTLLPSLSVFCAPLRYVQGAGATLAIGREMLAVGLQGPALFVAGPTAIEQLAPTWAIAMKEIHWTHRVRVFAGESSRREIQAIVAEAANLKARVIVGAGGGKVLDAARAAAAATQIGFVSCPTICSTDAPTSALSVIYSENRAAHGAAEVEMYEIHKRSPDLVLVDTRVIAQSPSRFLAAGIGDAMSTFYEARAVVTAGKPNMRGGLSTLAAFELSRLCRDTVLAHGEAAMADCCNQTESKSLALVVEAATLLSGLGFESAGLAAAQQLARAGHTVTVFEKNDRVGGLLRYGIPDFKMEKSHIDRRVEQMQAEGVVFRTGVMVGEWPQDSKVTNWSKETVSASQLQAEFDAVLLTGGSEQSRDLPVPGRDLNGIHFAMEFLPQQNKVNAGDKLKTQLRADGKHVVVIGGGDTGSDCVGTSNRHGAVEVVQFEVMPEPPVEENRPMTWPYWPLKLRTSSSHEEGCEREFAISTKEFVGARGKVTGVKTVRVEWQGGKMVEVPGSEKIVKADLVLLAMGFVNPVASVLSAFGVTKDARGNARAHTDEGGYGTNVPKVFAAGDMRRGQSLVVWAIREGRQAARSVDAFLMGSSVLPR